MEGVDKLPYYPPHFYIYRLFGMKVTNSVIIFIVPRYYMPHNHQEDGKPFNGINIFDSLFHINYHYCPVKVDK